MIPSRTAILKSETLYFLARGIAARIGKVLTNWALSREYGIVYLDGRRRHWGN